MNGNDTISGRVAEASKGPAFPVHCSALKCEGDSAGMTLRDYFAAKAMNGMIACPDTKPDIADAELARVAYHIADAMLAERERRQTMSISIEVYDPLCETLGCAARATRNLVVDGVVKSRHCTRHSTPALIAANRAEREKKGARS